MQLGLDVTALVYGRGVSRYTANLLTSLAARDDLELSLYAATKRGQPQLKAALQTALSEIDQEKAAAILERSLIKKRSVTWQKFLWGNLHAGAVKKALPGIEVFHSWDYLQPPDKKLPLVSTIHDLAMLKFPESVHPDLWRAHQRSWQILRERGAQIITVSQSSKNDILELLDLPDYQVTVIHEALPRETARLAERMTRERYQELKNTLAQDKPFILFVGTREPRKNLTRLIDAWKSISDDFDLLIAGSDGWDKTQGQKWPGLKFLGQVSDEILVTLYHEAAALAYPSLDEGFGLPILEAFYFNLPVVTSDLSAMKEVAGEAAVLVDPFSVESIKDGLIKAVSLSGDEKLTWRDRAALQLAKFSWDQCAAATSKVYQKAAAYA